MVRIVDRTIGKNDMSKPTQAELDALMASIMANQPGQIKANYENTMNSVDAARAQARELLKGGAKKTAAKKTTAKKTTAKKPAAKKPAAKKPAAKKRAAKKKATKK